MLVPTILPAVTLVNTYQQMAQLMRILPVQIVQRVQAAHMLMEAVPVRRILVVVTILPVVTLVNTYQQLAQIQLILPVPIVQHVVVDRKLQEGVVVQPIEHVLLVQTQHVRQVAHSIRLVLVQEPLTQHVAIVHQNQHVVERMGMDVLTPPVL
jgi:hypothetical protein